MLGMLAGLLLVANQPAPAGQPVTQPPAPASTAPATTLNPGDKAPPYTATKWFSALPVTSTERGKAYVLVFWKIDTDANMRVLMHLTDITHDHNDVACIALHDITETITLAQVEEWVNARRAHLHFTIGADELHASWNAWMKPSGTSATPTAFIINRDGRLAFAGPAKWIDGPLKQVLAGDWEFSQAAGLSASLQSRYDAMIAKAGKDWAGFLTDWAFFEADYPLAIADKPGMKIRALYAVGKGADVQKDLNTVINHAQHIQDREAMLDIAAALLDGIRPNPTAKQAEAVAARQAASLADRMYESRNALAKACLAESWLISDADTFAAEEARKGLDLNPDDATRTRLKGILSRAEAEAKKRKTPPPPPRRRP